MALSECQLSVPKQRQKTHLGIEGTGVSEDEAEATQGGVPKDTEAEATRGGVYSA